MYSGPGVTHAVDGKAGSVITDDLAPRRRSSAGGRGGPASPGTFAADSTARHAGGGFAGDEAQAEAREMGTSLGQAPHMVRGCLFGFTQACMTGPAFSQCVACSPAVVGAAGAEGWGFVRRAVCEPGFLDRVTGLDELRRRVEELEVLDEGDDAAAEGSGGDDGWTAL